MNIILDGVSYEMELIKRENRIWPYFFGGEIITETYKCPLCGKGIVSVIHEDTPGDRDHSMNFECENCHKEGRYYKNKGGWNTNWWEFVSMTAKEIEDFKERENKINALRRNS